MDDIEQTPMNTSEKRPVSRLWNVFGQQLPRSEIVFICQILLIYTVTIVSLVNLTRGSGPSQLWIALLSSSLGYLLPNPTISHHRK